MNRYKILEWDSDFFGFPVAKILNAELKKNNLREILKDLKKRKVRLIYYSSEKNILDDEIVKKFNGFFTGQKVIFVLDLKKTSKNNINLPDGIKLEKYNKKTPSPDLTNLIVEGGIYSRFYVDPKINKKKYQDLHKLWIKNSVKENDIFVLNKDRATIGFISLNEKNNRANIDFIVVDKKYRGMGFATALINHAHNWLLSKRYETIQADTQKENINAVNMYEKFGYKQEKIINFYHFWI